jgi:hypothetical protein
MKVKIKVSHAEVEHCAVKERLLDRRHSAAKITAKAPDERAFARVSSRKA